MGIATQQTNDEQELGIVYIEQNKLELFEGKYNEMAQRAHTDNTYESDYIAAYLAPAKFMNRPSGFEASFDIILFHLNEAYRKSISKDEKLIISRTVEDIFSRLLIVIQDKIQVAKQSAVKKFFKNLFKSIRNVQENFFNTLEEVNETTKNIFNNELKNVGAIDILKMNPKGQLLFSIGPEISNITEAFVTCLYERWEIKQNEEYFYMQVLSVFEKILNADCFENHGLVKNCFLRVKNEILPFAYYHKGVDICLFLGNFDDDENNKIETNRILVNVLIESKKWELPYDYLEHRNNPEYRQFIDILKWFYISVKEEILTHTILKYGKEEAVKLTSYDTDQKGVNDTVLTVLRILVNEGEWEEVFDFHSSIKINNKKVYDRATKMLIDYYTEYCYRIYSNNKGNVDYKKADEAIKQFELRLKSPEEYEGYMVNYHKKKNKEKRNRIFAIVFICLLFSAYQVYRYDAYREIREDEVKRIEMVEKQTALLFSEDKLIDALSIIKSNLIWNETSFPFSMRDEKLATTKKEDLLLELINLSYKSISDKVFNELDNKDYENIYLNYFQAITSSMNLLPEKIQKESMIEASQYFNKINNARHAYLTLELDKINNLFDLGEKQEAIKLTSNLYHYSEDKFESAFLGFGTVTFKEYWDKKRKKTIKDLQ